MRKIIRSLSIGFLAFVGAIILGISWTMTTAIQLQVTTALIMGGSFNPDPDAAYVADVSQRYINPFADLPYDPPPLAVHTPEQFFPVFGTLTFDDSVAEGVVDLQDAVDANTPNANDRVIIFGYSQSGRIATIAKRNFVEDYNPADREATPIAGFVLLANPNKPNGGILERYKFVGTIPFLGITFDGATPTDGPQNPDGSYVAPTKDITFLYDGISDHPVWVLNPLALLNALAGYVYLHGESPTADANLIYQGSAGDTDYYIVDDDIVPILRPLGDIGVPHFILSALDEPLRVLIETAYRRDLGPGVPVTASLLPHVNPITVTANLIESIPVGIDDALEELGLGRPLGTTPPGPYGVGGPALPDPPAPVSATSASAEVSTAAQPLASKSDSEPQVVSRNDDEAKDESAQQDTAPTATAKSESEPVKPESDTVKPESEPVKPESDTVKPESEPVKADTKNSDTKNSDRPKVRGPIQFDSKKKPKESPSSPSDEPSTTTRTSATKTASTATTGPTGSSESESKAAA
jgi:PE-PPE domain-containing protein